MYLLTDIIDFKDEVGLFSDEGRRWDLTGRLAELIRYDIYTDPYLG